MGSDFKDLSSSLSTYGHELTLKMFNDLWKHSPNIQVSDVLCYKPIPKETLYNLGFIYYKDMTLVGGSFFYV